MPPEKLSTQQYIEGFRNGDPTVIKGIYEKYHQAIVHLVETKHGTIDDANDVFQEGLVIFYQKTQQLDFNLTSTFLTYFYAICKNIWYNKLRKKSSTEVTLDDKMLSMVQEDDAILFEQSERYFLYRKMFLKLGADCQKVLDLFLQKISMEEIMKVMGYGSVSYTKKRKFQCKEKLVKLIKSEASFAELKTESYNRS